jgi:3-keto-disaccharide hydrolase
MRVKTWAAIGLMSVLGFATAAEPQAWKLSGDSLGKLPPGWAADKTGTGDGSVWKVVADGTAPSKTGLVLAQTAAGPSALFNLCVKQDESYKDVELRVAFKAVKGENDQGGGFVWHYQNPNNYYVARFNPLEDNFRFYHVIDGKRTQLVTKEGIKIPTGTWHTLAVKHVGDKVECFLDGKKQLDATDSMIQKPGKVGLWTKADAQTHFDNFQVIDLGK